MTKVRNRPRWLVPPLLALAGLGLPAQALVAAQLSIPANFTLATGGGATISVVYQAQGAATSALQFDLLYDSAGLSIRGVNSSAATAAGKTLSFANVTGGTRFVVLGQNQNVIGDGGVADLIVQAKPGAAGTYAVLFNNVVVSDATASPVSVNTASGNITVGAQCSFSIDSTSANVGNGSGSTSSLTGSFTLTATSCNASNSWTAVSDSPSLVVTSHASGNGVTASTTIGWAMYTNSTTQPRTAHINVAGFTFTVNQAGSVESQSQRVVRALYQSILGREPDPGGWAFWTGSGAPTSAGAVLYNQMADGFYRSPEFRDSAFAVLSIYQAVTGQLPSFNAWLTTVTQLRRAGLTTTQLTDFLAGSTSNPAFVQQGIQNGLGRPATSAEIASYSAQLSSGTYASKFDFLNRVIFTDPAFQSQTNDTFVRALYYTILLRDPDTSGLSFWSGQLTNSPGMPGIYYVYLAPPAAYARKLAVIGQAVPPNFSFLGFLGSPEFQGLIQ